MDAKREERGSALRIAPKDTRLSPGFAVSSVIKLGGTFTGAFVATVGKEERVGVGRAEAVPPRTFEEKVATSVTRVCVGDMVPVFVMQELWVALGCAVELGVAWSVGRVGVGSRVTDNVRLDEPVGR